MKTEMLNKKLLMILVLLCIVLPTTLNGTCGGNCPSNNCNYCNCGSVKNIISLD